MRGNQPYIADQYMSADAKIQAWKKDQRKNWVFTYRKLNAEQSMAWWDALWVRRYASVAPLAELLSHLKGFAEAQLPDTHTLINDGVSLKAEYFDLRSLKKPMTLPCGTGVSIGFNIKRHEPVYVDPFVSRARVLLDLLHDPLTQGADRYDAAWNTFSRLARRRPSATIFELPRYARYSATPSAD